MRLTGLLGPIFFTIISWVNPLWAGVDCVSKLQKNYQTKSHKMSVETPIELHELLYTRDKNNPQLEGNFPVEDIFNDDVEVLVQRLRIAQRYVKMQKRKYVNNEQMLLDIDRFIDYGEQLISRGKSMLSGSYGYLTYFEYGDICIQFFKLSMQLYVADGYSIKQYLAQKGIKSESRSLAVKSYNGFPFYAIPSVTEFNRMDIVTMLTAPLWVRRIAVKEETVDSVELNPEQNATHDDQHASQIRSLHPFIKFESYSEFKKYMYRKQKALEHIKRKLELIDNPIVRLRLDQILFALLHETPSYSLDLDALALYNNHSVRHEIIKGARFRLDVLSEAEQKLLREDDKKWDLRLTEHYTQLVNLLGKWYVDADGPSTPLNLR